MIVDVGCGRTEAAVLSLGEIAAGVSVRIASAAMDEAICRYLRTEHALWVDARAAERLKVGLGSALPPTKLEKARTKEALGIDPLDRAPKTVTVSSAEIYEAIDGCVRTIVEAARSTLERTPVELVSDIAEDSIALTGGGARLRHFADLLGQKLGVSFSSPKSHSGAPPWVPVDLWSGKVLTTIARFRRREASEHPSPTRRFNIGSRSLNF